MNSVFKLSGMLLMSAFAFTGMYLLKVTLNKLIPVESNTVVLCRAMTHIIFEGRFWVAVLCYGAAMAVYLFLLQSDQVSKIFSMTVGINILLTALGASFFLGDKIDGARAVGILLVVIGIFLINGLHQWK